MRTRFRQSAWLRASTRGNHGIEIDVVLSADGVAMVFHDLDLDRLTAERGPVVDRSSAELSRIALGRSTDTIPTLAETLRVIGGTVPVVIELKGHDESDVTLVRAVAQALDGYSGASAIMSFDPWLVRAFRTDCPAIPRGLTAEGTSAAALEAHFAMLAHDLHFVSYNVHHLPNPFVAFVRNRLGLPVITWTVRDADAVARTREFADQMTFEGFRP